jgi:hypothetical protein
MRSSKKMNVRLGEPSGSCFMPIVSFFAEGTSPILFLLTDMPIILNRRDKDLMTVVLPAPGNPSTAIMTDKLSSSPFIFHLLKITYHDTILRKIKGINDE